MNNKEVIEKTKEYVKQEFAGFEPGHDWFHIERVWKMTKRIATKEKANMFVVELAALLHDIDDYKFSKNGQQKKYKVWLEKLEIKKDDMRHISEIIENVSFKGSGEKNKISSLEGKIVQDADRLDALGAIGIARNFSFAGHKKNPFFDPRIKIKKNMKFSEYKKTDSPAINHFYEKLLLLKERMNTKTGKRIAIQRHKFMERYLKQFFKEWNGKD